MKKTKIDPVKDFQKQCVDQRVCLFYVADRLLTISNMTDGKKAHKALWEFKEECVYNIGTNELIKRYEY